MPEVAIFARLYANATASRVQYERFAEFVQREDLDGVSAYRMSHSDGGYIIAGSASTVRDRLKKDNEIAGINYCLCRLAFGDLSFEESARSIELLAKEVMPAL